MQQRLKFILKTQIYLYYNLELLPKPLNLRFSTNNEKDLNSKNSDKLKFNNNIRTKAITLEKGQIQTNIAKNTSIQQQTEYELERAKRLKALKMEYELLKYEQEANGNLPTDSEPIMQGDETSTSSRLRIPTQISDSSWDNLLGLESRKQRIKYYSYLWKNEMSDANIRQKKEARLLARQSEKLQALDESDPHIKYGLSHNTMFFYLRDSIIKHYWRSRLALNLMIPDTPNVVIDMSFEQAMNDIEKAETANQIRELFQLNRLDRQPFNLHICNIGNRDVKITPTSKESTIKFGRKLSIMEMLEKRMVDLNEMFMQFTEKSYLDLFPTQNLVYLSPNASEYMKDYDPNAVYIIGALVERGHSKPFTLAKAKRERIKTQRLPIDKYLRWGMGGKELTLNQVLGILLDIKNTKSWDIALQHVPRRKLYQGPEAEEIQEDKRFKHILRSC